MLHQDKVALITGAGSGIGRNTAYTLAAEGARIVVTDINQEGGQETVENIKSKGGDAFFIKNNVADWDDVQHMFRSAVDHYGRIDIAVNNAGIGSPDFAKTADKALEDWDRIIAVNQTGVFYCMKVELTHMLKQGGGCIINIASIAGIRGLPNASAYVASKHAVVGLTRTAAMEYAKRNIRVNALCPVFTPSGLFKPELYGEIADKLKAGIPMKRFSDVQEMADAINWLASDKASFVTGHALPVDGGLTA
ncbi:MAG: glucose 1-dehydrogenase [Bacteroidia bacterium]|nr:glucose 1-dehydrogenase [Bacteroidia bacterium]